MPFLDTLFEFSRSHCIAICATLVPANLLATLQTMLFVGFRRPLPRVWLMAGVSSVYAAVLFLHVVTWLAIGVVMIPTFVLTVLSCVCISINIGCVAIGVHRCPVPARTPRHSTIDGNPQPTTAEA